MIIIGSLEILPSLLIVSLEGALLQPMTSSFTRGHCYVSDFKIACALSPLSLLFIWLSYLYSHQFGSSKHKVSKVLTTSLNDFDQKWLRNYKNSDEALLGTGDIQSLADLGNRAIVVRWYQYPFVTDDVVRLLIATLAPIFPLLLTIMPLEQLLTQVVKFIL